MDDVAEHIASIRDALHTHSLEDDVRFKEINEKLDSILEVMSAFKLGWKGLMGVGALIVMIGTIITIGMRLIGK